MATILGASLAFALPQEQPSADSSRSQRTDTTKIDQTIARFMPAIGSLNHRIDTTDALHSNQSKITDAKYLGDLMWKVPGFFVRDLGEVGQPGELHATGIDGRGISLQLDGRPLRDPITGVYGLYEIPLEYVEQVEIVSGANSLYYGSNAPGAVANIVTHQYDNVRPMTKIRYLQGPFEYILSDGIFAQNFARGSNAMVGFQRHVTDGRFANTKYDAWNLRSRIRFNYSDRLNIWISDFYNRSKRGFNGGIDVGKSPSLYDEVTAITRSQNAGETISRRDVTLGATARLLADSSAISQALLYYSTVEREYREGANLPGSPAFTNLNAASSWGLKLSHGFPIPSGRIETGLDFERRRVEQSRTVGERSESYAALRGKAELHFGDLITTEFSTRGERLRDENSFSFGLRFSRKFDEGFGAFAEYSRSYRLPTILEMYGADSMLTRTSPVGGELHTLRGLGIQMEVGSTLDWSIVLSDRTIADPIVFTSVASPGVFPHVQISTLSKISVTTLSTRFILRAWDFELNGVLTYTDYREGQSSVLVLPRFWSHGELSYRASLIDRVLDGKLALRVKMASNQRGLQFVPPLSLFARQTEMTLGSFSTIDLYTVVKLGNAHLTLVWENPMNVDYTLTAFYPMPGRNIKLGVNWVFVD
ncbi:MAG: TonB-dependent receptor [Ignavibacteria bacterium]|nr:TonB-dependent receptor [Ignavibacteria bacterium]